MNLLVLGIGESGLANVVEVLIGEGVEEHELNDGVDGTDKGIWTRFGRNGWLINEDEDANDINGGGVGKRPGFSLGSRFERRGFSPLFNSVMRESSSRASVLSFTESLKMSVLTLSNFPDLPLSGKISQMSESAAMESQSEESFRFTYSSSSSEI